MSDKKYQCDQCNEKFGNPQALKFHKENKHFICGILGKSLMLSVQLTNIRR
jgi:transcription elongation factor Elf1